ncbi:tRNA-intron endonuclease [Senna tora]|uniref:tRNA-intron endonuclease n=1 Tax=Senna tora TaxID=362788 RepID=A0A834X6H2_9FABA|nr:tRNA-intron endonuclease [Senna tora]
MRRTFAAWICTSICPHCLPSHRLHRLLQVRRYVYHDVVRLEDLQKLIDCSNVQKPPRTFHPLLPRLQASSGGSENNKVVSTRSHEIVRKKRSGWNVCARLMSSNNNKVSDEDVATGISRRKGIPHRSPLC